MSISVSVGVMIPANVVEVGDEITSDQLAAITSASTPTSANPFLTLAGGTLTGSLIFDAVGLQNINKGTFDNSLGGYNGISLTCAVGYELNWQGGHLTNWYSNAAQTIYIDSPIDITNAGGITFSDDSVQTTAAVSGVSSAKAFANAVAIHTWYQWDGNDYARQGTINPEVDADISDGVSTVGGLPATANITILDPDSYWYVSKDGVLSDTPIHSP